MPAWPASLVSDFKALAAAWNSIRGGWRGAWRDTVQLLARRRILVDTHAQTRNGMRVVLRTRVRLTGDVQTDILRCWLYDTPGPSIEALSKTHFQFVADAARGWSAVSAIVRLGSQVIVASGAIVGIPSAVRSSRQAGWESLVPALLTNWWVVSGIAAAALGFLVRRVVRVWLRKKFRGGLSIGSIGQAL
jgi:hypothetical protein